jgi:hypothetical protein
MGKDDDITVIGAKISQFSKWVFIIYKISCWNTLSCLKYFLLNSVILILVIFLYK